MQKKSREEKMSEIQKKLEDGIREIFESGAYAEYIKAFSRFPRYSINNCILIASQRPDATYVCGMKTWNEFNRRVNKNEHGIMILAPVKRKADVEEQVFDEDNHPVVDDKGKPVTEKVTREYQSFRPVYVWDYGQTSGEPLPSLAHTLVGSVDEFEELKQVLIEVSPVPISFEPIKGIANGFYSPKEERIVIKEGLSELQTIKTILHEIAHASLGHGGENDKWDRQTHEVQAESVAFWVAAMIKDKNGNGLDTSDYSFGYISGWSKNKELSELKESIEVIKKIADQLSQAIEAKLKERDEQKKMNQEEEPEVYRSKGR